MKKTIKIRDINAKTMWGKVKNVVFRDRTKYTRKIKHKKNFF